MPKNDETPSMPKDAPTKGIRKHTTRAKSATDRTNEDRRKDRKPILATRSLPARPPVPPLQQGPMQMIIPLFQNNNSKFSRQEERYLDSLEEKERKTLLDKFQNISQTNATPLRFRVLNSKLKNKMEIVQRLQSCDSQKFEMWVDSALKLPLETFTAPPLQETSKESISAYLNNVMDIMDRSVHGQMHAKEEILRLVCQWTTSGKLSTFAIGFEGPPGIGKTTFAKQALSSCMNRPFCFISLGGMTDACSLVGHSYTYEGAICGRIAECIKECGVMNPILYFDELDKISKTPKGEEIISILIHLTDKEQNSHFRDRYFHGIDLDLSNALIVFSYNNSMDINPILLDRMNVIKFEAPNKEEKIVIAQKHLIPRAVEQMGLTTEDITFSDETLRYMIEHFTNEQGVRALDRAIFKVMGTLNLTARMSSMNTKKKLANVEFPYDCDETTISEIMGPETNDNMPSHVASMYM